MSLNKFGIDTDEAIKLAFEVRPELISAQKEMEAAKMNLRAERRNYTPNIGIFGSYGNNLGSVYDVQTRQIGVGLNYNGLNVLKIKKQVDEAGSTYNMTKARYQEVKDTVYFNKYLNARLDFYNAILNYNVTAANLEQEIGIPLKQIEEKVIDITPEDL